MVWLFPGLGPGIGPSQQGGNPRQQVIHAHVLGDIVIGAQPQAVNGIDVTVPCCQKNDGNGFGQAAQVLAQGKAAFGFIAQSHVNNGQIGQGGAQHLESTGAVTIGRHPVTPALEGVTVVFPDGGFVFNQHDVSLHSLQPFPC
jgi:hypothetical protein